MMDGIREYSNEEIFLFELMDFAEKIGPNRHKPGYFDYRLETPKEIGFVITAVKEDRTDADIWHIDSWYTYNA